VDCGNYTKITQRLLFTVAGHYTKKRKKEKEKYTSSQSDEQFKPNGAQIMYIDVLVISFSFFRIVVDVVVVIVLLLFLKSKQANKQTIQPSQLNYVCHSCGKSGRSGYSPLLAENIHITMHTDAPGSRRMTEERGCRMQWDS